MSVSAHPTPQPGTEEYQPVFVSKTLEQLGEILTRYPTKQAALLPALWLVQQARGWISDRNMAEVAEVLGLTPAYVKGVVTFYTMYHQHPVGRHFVQVCTTSPCNICGAEAVVKALLDATGAGRGILLKLGVAVAHLHVHIYPVSASMDRAGVFAAFDGKTRFDRDEPPVANLRRPLTNPTE